MICSSLWEPWGQGFEPPQLHQFLTRGYGAIRDPALLSGGSLEDKRAFAIAAVNAERFELLLSPLLK